MVETKISITDVVTLKNITGHDINPGDITWDSKDIIKMLWRPEEKRSFVRFEADHILKKMIDEKIIRGRGGIKMLRDKKTREEFKQEAIVEDVMSGVVSNVVEGVIEAPIVEEIKEDKLIKENMKVLKKKATDLGIDYKFGITKVALIEKIRNAETV